jgi:hypothetical protein
VGNVESIITVSVPEARRVGPHKIVPGRGWARLADGRAVEVHNVSTGHKASVGDRRMVRKGLGGTRYELVTS